MRENYTYPLNLEWTNDELVCVMKMWQTVEKAYEKGIPIEECLENYKQFKQIIRSIGEEKKLGKEFEEVSGYSLYRTIQQAKILKKGRLKMQEDSKK